MPAVQASMVARYAYNNLSKRNFAILHPRNNYGATLARFFAAEVERLGGEVVSTVSYKPGVRDFSTQLVEMFEIEETERMEGRRTIKEYTQTLQVDALYIPEYYQTVSLIVPYLEYYNIEELQLLGSNGWNTMKLIELNGKSVEDAVFADGFFAGSTRPETVEFVERFREAYGHVPGVLEAQAYDSASALFAALSENDFKWMDWRTVRNGVKGTTDLRGSSGSLSFDENGEAMKRLFLLAVERGRIIEVEGGTQVEVESDTQAEPSGEL
jgi:ABC-type branched-subunit amino acid transport system substrate-binding protein